MKKPLTPKAISRKEKLQHLDLEFKRKFLKKMRLEDEFYRCTLKFKPPANNPINLSYKYKKAFSAGQIEYLLGKFGVLKGTLLDPFAGGGTAMFAASSLGINADGIELLPVGQLIIETKQIIDSGLSLNEIKVLEMWRDTLPWRNSKGIYQLKKLRFMRRSFSLDTVKEMGQFLAALRKENERIRKILLFLLLSILDILSTSNNKPISFEKVICKEIQKIVSDLRGNKSTDESSVVARRPGKLNFYKGSCLDILPTLKSSSYNIVITSPPYCNYYDFISEFAYELALLGISKRNLTDLRRKTLSCTIGNRSKDLLLRNPKWRPAIQSVDNQKLLLEILSCLNEQESKKIPPKKDVLNMIKRYFYDMACVIAECGRVLKKNSRLIMVCSNVNHDKIDISVDFILSDIAKSLGFEIESILVLQYPDNNCSPQNIGDKELAPRKCIYVWKNCKKH